MLRAHAIGEAAGQHRAGQRDDDEVADGEVVCAADDSPRLGLADVDLAPADRLAVVVLLHDEVEHPADHQRSGHVRSRPIDGLDLEPGPDQGIGQSAAVDIVGQGRVLADPAQRGLHRASPIRERLNRTSPSIMSRMSSALLRNISVRSTPMPNANPV